MGLCCNRSFTNRPLQGERQTTGYAGGYDSQKGTDEESVGKKNSRAFWFFDDENKYPAAEMQIWGDESYLKKIGYWYGNEIEWLGADAMKEDGLLLLGSATLQSERTVTDEDGNEVNLKYKTYSMDITLG